MSTAASTITVGGVHGEGQRDTVAILEQDALNDVDLRIDVVPESLSVMADRALLEQVLLNLVKNALDALNGDGRIAVAASLEQLDAA